MFRLRTSVASKRDRGGVLEGVRVRRVSPPFPVSSDRMEL